MTSQNIRVVLLDSVLTVTIFSPLVLCFWSSTWSLLDLYLVPSNHTLSASISLAAGAILMMTSFFVQGFCNRHVTVENHITYLIVSRIYTYILSVAMVLNWRGVWYLMDIYAGPSLFGVGISFAVGTVGLLLLRAYRNVLAPPGVWVLDVEAEAHFTITTRFRAKSIGLLFILDVLFGVAVISTLVIIVWRGQWLMLEEVLAPLSNSWRGGSAFMAGNIALVLMMILQYPARKLSIWLESYRPWLKVAFEDVALILVCAMCVTYWFGLWRLLVVLYSQYDQYLTWWFTHIFGFGGMLLLRVCSSLQFKGYFIDGELPGGLGLVLTPTYYRAFMYKEECDKEKTDTQETEMTAM